MATGFKTLKRQDSHQQNTPLPPPASLQSSIEPRKDGTAQEDAEKASTPSFLRQVKEKDAQRDQQLRSVMMGGIRKGDKAKRRAARREHNSQVMAMRQARATFPVTLKVEQRAFQRDPDKILRPGKVMTSQSTDIFSIKTLHQPFKGSQSVEATSFEELRHALERVYEVRFKDGIHRHHEHPSQKDGPIIEGKIRLQPWQGVEERVLNEQNWHEALALLAAQQLPYSHNGKILTKSRMATIVASFTCPRTPP